VRRAIHACKSAAFVSAIALLMFLAVAVPVATAFPHPQPVTPAAPIGLPDVVGIYPGMFVGDACNFCWTFARQKNSSAAIAGSDLV
jgi:hypothetical protein